MRYNQARYLAPLTLVVAVIVVIIVVTTSGVDEKSPPSKTVVSSKRSHTTTKTVTVGQTVPAESVTTEPGELPLAEFYTVEEGDILSTIAEKAGVSLERLRELNPDLDPQTLVAGQQVRLRPADTAAESGTGTVGQ